MEHRKFTINADYRLTWIELGTGQVVLILHRQTDTKKRLVFSFIHSQSGLNLSFRISLMAYFSRKSSLAVFLQGFRCARAYLQDPGLKAQEWEVEAGTSSGARS